MQEHIKIAAAAGLGLIVGLLTPYAIGKAKAADKGGYARSEEAEPAKVGGLSVYVGAHGGMSIASTEVSSDLLPGLSLDGLGSRGAIGGIHAGVDYRFGGGVFGGIYGTYSWQNTEFALTFPGAAVTIGLGDTYSVGGRLGYDWGSAKAYALVAWRRTDLEWGIPIPLPGVGLPSKLDGVDLGLGIAMPIAKNIELGLEGVHTSYDTGNISAGGIDVANLDTTQLSVMARLSFKLGGY